MCTPLNPLTCPELIARLGDAAGAVADTAGNVASSAVDGLLEGLAQSFTNGLTSMVAMLASWLFIPSTNLCPGTADGSAEWVQSCNTSAYPAVAMRSWVLPITLVIAVVGLLWQGIMMALTRRGEPLLQAVRGLGGTAVWGAVGIAGPQLALRAGDSFTTWVLDRAVFGDQARPPNETFAATLTALLVPTGLAPLLITLFEMIAILVVLVQIVLMVFREGAVVILAGLTQLAAAGSFTRATSGWLAKVTGWMAALICYKPMVALLYATAFALLSSPEQSGRNFMVGLGVLVLSVVALPAMLRFFTWTVGSLSTPGGSGLGMLGTAAAAGMHAGSALRGIGGNRATDHAAFLSTNGPNSGTTPSDPPSSPSPTGADTSSPTTLPTTPPSPTPTAAGSGTSGVATSAGTAATGAATAGVTLVAETVANTARETSRRATDATTDAMGGS